MERQKEKDYVESLNIEDRKKYNEKIGVVCVEPYTLAKEKSLCAIIGSHFKPHMSGLNGLSTRRDHLKPIGSGSKNKGGLIDSGQPSVTRPDQATHAQSPGVAQHHQEEQEERGAAGEQGAVFVFVLRNRNFSSTMSGFDSNPFADPVDVNPFQDASITQATGRAGERLGDFNPFSATETGNHSGTTIPVSAASSQPAVLQTSVEQSPKATAAAAQANLVKQQEELERKAAELERKEQELENRRTSRAANSGAKENNWPPLPKFFPVNPCFYQDFEEEIPEDYRRICKRMYYLWMFHSATLFLNVLACLAYFTADSQNGVDFGLSILWFILFTPVAFICWYRPVYKAFRSDSSFSFFFFFFVFFFQVAVYVIQTVGIPHWGNSGWIASITMIRTNLAVAVVMMVVAGFFTVNAVLAVILLKMVHSKYRNTGASFTKAQQEFSQGVLTNRTVQTAAAGAATSAAQGAFGRSQGN